MPTFACCPGYIYPSKLQAHIGANIPECMHLAASFQVNWNGVDSWDGGDGDSWASVQCKMTANGQLVIEVDGGLGECIGGVVSQDSHCLQFSALLNVVASTDCCNVEPGHQGIAPLSFSFPTPVAIADPDVVVPPCATIPPADKCRCKKSANGGLGGNGSCNSTGCSGGGNSNWQYPPMSAANPVRYATGELQYSASDVQSAGYGEPWGHTRTFHNRQSLPETLGNGYNWHVEQWPYLVIRSSGDINLQGYSGGPFFFDLTGEGYVCRFGLKQRLEPSGTSYLFTDLDGTTLLFDAVTGRFLSQTSPGGATIAVNSLNANGYNINAVQRSYTASGTTVTEELAYEYDTSSGDALLSQVTLRRQTNGGGWMNIQRANYTYYDQGDSRGAEEDLALVVQKSWVEDAWITTGTTHYRYWLTLPTGSSSSSSSSSSSGGSSPFGAPPSHLLKSVLKPGGYDRMVNDGFTDPTAVADSLLAQYADYYFEYDPTSHRVTLETVKGGSQTFRFSYSQSNFADGYNTWKTKTTETLPDGSEHVIYSDYAGLTMLTAVRSGADEWLTYYQYDQARVVFQANPSALTGYDETSPDLLDFDAGGLSPYLRDNDGLIRRLTYHAPSGYAASETVQQGQLGLPILLWSKEYTPCGTECGGSSSSSAASSSSGSSTSSGSSGSPVPDAFTPWFLSREVRYPSATDPSQQEITSYCYTWHAGTCAIKERVTTLPIVSTTENGTGVAATRREYFDTYGNQTWSMDERGFITHIVYDIPTGAMIQRIDDVDTSTASGVPAGWVTPSGGGLNLITDYEIDSQGRTTQILGPVHQIDLSGSATTIRRATWMVYDDDSTGRTTRSAQGYATGSSPSYTFTLINPVSITKTDLGGRTTEQIVATRGPGITSAGKLTSSDTFAQSSYVRWSTMQYTDCCFVASQRVYHTIPATGSGSSGTNYDESDYGYTVMKRRNRIVTPGGTITFLVYDVRGQLLETWVGTNDTGATENDPSGGGASGNNMKKITALEYDGGVDGGDGNVTQQTQYVTASDTRVTTFTYDFRDRRIETDGEIDFFEKLTLDNLDRVTRVDRYDTSASGNLVGRSDTKYDARGRVWRTIRYGVDPSTGTVGQSLTDNTWYDAAGNTLCSVPSGALAFTKTVYDSLGRPATRYMGYNATATTSAPLGSGTASSVTADVILEQSETTYDAPGNAIESRQRQRYHNAPESQTGPLQNPSNNPKARVSYAAAYPDALGRAQASADYGTNGGTALSRPATIPARSDTCLVSSQTYSAAGNLLNATDPAGLVTAFTYDALGRELTRIQNPQGGSSSSSGSSASAASSSSSTAGNTCTASEDANVSVTTTYNADGNVSSVTASNANTGPQTTQYVYGTTLSDSEIATSLLKQAEIYPDSTGGSDQITFSYNRQSQVTVVVDQGGTTHAYDYDKLGRQTQDRVTALGSDVDGAVRRIASTYEVRGMRQLLTSLDNPTVGSGSVLNQSQFVYNDFSQLVTEYQAHEGSVNTSTTAKVQYTYASGSANTIRSTGMVYPSGRVLSYAYGSVGGQSDRLSRVESYIDDDGTSHIIDYTFLGAGTFVESDRPQPSLKWSIITDQGGTDPNTGDIYRGLDRFGRVTDNQWFGYGTGSNVDLDRIRYGYDRAGNRIWRENPVATSFSKEFDEIYSYDALHRLKDMARGRLNTAKTAPTSTTFAQCWTLDSTGNWSGFREDDTGDGTWDLVQARTANDVNEIAGIINSVGAGWVQPAYSPAGNMTTMPQPNDPTNGYTATYDAWNRLVKIVDTPTSNTVSEYAYDGAKRQIRQKNYAAGTLTETRHLYYTDPASWQRIEERLGTSPDTAPASRHIVWGIRHIDELVCVIDHDSQPADGSSSSATPPVQQFFVSDAAKNVTATVSASALVIDRIAYDAYGTPRYLTAAFNPSPAQSTGLQFLFASQPYHTTVGLYLVRNRWFSCRAGVWLTRDEAANGHGTGLYEYVNSSPLTLIDPDGNAAVLAVPVIGIIIIGFFIVVTWSRVGPPIPRISLPLPTRPTLPNPVSQPVQRPRPQTKPGPNTTGPTPPLPPPRGSDCQSRNPCYPTCSSSSGYAPNPEDATRLPPRDSQPDDPSPPPNATLVGVECGPAGPNPSFTTCPTRSGIGSLPGTKQTCNMKWIGPNGGIVTVPYSIRCCPCCRNGVESQTCNNLHIAGQGNRKG
jgi:RHS repeat-associated protein